jgi:hypothetical protein
MESENDFYLDIAYKSLNKKGEELCGDKVEIFKSDERSIIVLADGLGSGVKANILATLTSKIAITMLKKGAEIEEVIETIIHTLPVCKVRNVAYSTFSIIEIDDHLNCKIFESDNPPFFFIRNGKVMKPEKTIKKVHDKKINITAFKLQENDLLYLCSDGVVHAGVGDFLDFGWEWPNVAGYLEKQTEAGAALQTQRVIAACNELYQESPGDDTTVITIKVRKPVQLLLFTGPPINRELDVPFVNSFYESKGKKVVCGGTAANIVSRVLDQPINTHMNYVDKNLPPTASIKGIDLVTEGVLTINRTIEMIEQWQKNGDLIDIKKEDGATKLFKILVEDCTQVIIWLGKAINEAHQNPDFPRELSMKMNVVERLVKALHSIGKEASIQYISEVKYK